MNHIHISLFYKKSCVTFTHFVYHNVLEEYIFNKQNKNNKFNMNNSNNTKIIKKNPATLIFVQIHTTIICKKVSVNSSILLKFYFYIWWMLVQKVNLHFLMNLLAYNKITLCTRRLFLKQIFNWNYNSIFKEFLPQLYFHTRLKQKADYFEFYKNKCYL